MPILIFACSIVTRKIAVHSVIVWNSEWALQLACSPLLFSFRQHLCFWELNVAHNLLSSSRVLHCTEFNKTMTVIWQVLFVGKFSLWRPRKLVRIVISAGIRMERIQQWTLTITGGDVISCRMSLVASGNDVMMTTWYKLNTTPSSKTTQQYSMVCWICHGFAVWHWPRQVLFYRLSRVFFLRGTSQLQFSWVLLCGS